MPEYAPKDPARKTMEQILLYLDLKAEYGADGVAASATKLEEALHAHLQAVKALPIDEALAQAEPSTLPEIQALRPPAPRDLTVWKKL